MHTATIAGHAPLADFSCDYNNIENNEVRQHLHGRYIAPPKAVWELMEFPHHSINPSVIRLAVHAENQQMVYFNPGEDIPRQIENPPRTTLMGWMLYNAQNQDGRQILYPDFPQYYTWNTATRTWRRRQQREQFGRMYNANPNQGERFFVRLLLTIQRGCTSFEDLRTVGQGPNRVTHATNCLACQALGLLRNDEYWRIAFQETAITHSGHRQRLLFVQGLTSGDLTNGLAIWDEFRDSFCDDLEHHLQFLHVPDGLENAHFNYGLFLISQELQRYGTNLAFHNLPGYDERWEDPNNPIQVFDAPFNPPEVRPDHLNEDQLTAFNQITAHITQDPTTSHFFLNGSGGTGKTFLYKALATHYRDQGMHVVCVASTGLAASLLPLGRTAHSTFKVPLILDENSVCGISHQSQQAAQLRQTTLIIWDEAPMQHKHVVMAVERTLRDICDNEALFGGIPVVFGGDFKQTLPVIRHGGRAQQVEACLQQSRIWQHLQVLYLTQNMRLQETEANASYGRWLENMSYDPRLRGAMHLPPSITTVTRPEQQIAAIYPPNQLHILTPNTAADFFRGRAILSITNRQVVNTNAAVLDTYPGEPAVYHGENRADPGEEEADLIPSEVMQTLNCGSLPLSQLTLKVGVPVMLLRNIYATEGLCNGTMAIVTALFQNTIEVMVISGLYQGRTYLIPRLTMIEEEEFHFTLQRWQFPIRLGFAMTINKSQGQSLSHIGIDLTSDPFTHGQLYVALSRTTNVQGIVALVDPSHNHGQTQNVVYPEVLLHQTS